MGNAIYELFVALVVLKPLANYYLARGALTDTCQKSAVVLHHKTVKCFTALRTGIFTTGLET